MAFLTQLIQQEEENSLVQLGGDYGEVPAYMDESETAGGYKRDMPERFTAERDDRLMNSMIKNYAREITNDGAKTGHFFLNHDDALAASQEVTETHMGWDASRAKAYLGVDDAFENTWNHFDVNHDGLVEVERMP
jgi:hypothetical protein